MNKTGRNDPCPCGSGKKFKKCCESKAATKALSPERVCLQQSLMSSQKISSLFQRAKHVPSSEGKKSDSS
ncbi:MAG: SEC-C domain-containing protein [Chlamydiales bacterium]|jgi:hypothetical protein|nr:SEC-C domain-containing protein [Chlamydiales bacterium]